MNIDNIYIYMFLTTTLILVWGELLVEQRGVFQLGSELRVRQDPLRPRDPTEKSTEKSWENKSKWRMKMYIDLKVKSFKPWIHEVFRFKTCFFSHELVKIQTKRMEKRMETMKQLNVTKSICRLFRLVQFFSSATISRWNVRASSRRDVTFVFFDLSLSHHTTSDYFWRETREDITLSLVPGFCRTPMKPVARLSSWSRSSRSLIFRCEKKYR